MGCRCAERARAISAAVAAVKAGDIGAIKQNVGYVGRTLVEDARSGDLRRAAEQRLAGIRRGLVRR